MLGRLVNDVLSEMPPEFPWGDTLPLFRQADVRVCNLECVISDRGSPWKRTPKAFHFRTDAKNVQVLKAARMDAVSNANNHALDFESEALSDMLTILDKKNIARAGAGRDLAEASRPAFFERGGKRTALVSFTDNEPAWEATERDPGVFHVPVDPKDTRAEKLFGLVKTARPHADIVIVSAHWGPNWGYRPKKRHIPFGRLLIENGADIVFGHSCHVFQGIEIYKGGVILYSTGNFVDDYAVNEEERNDESFIFIVEIEEGRISRIRLYPTLIRYMQAGIAPPGLAEKIAEKMRTLCAEFGTEAMWDEAGHCLEIPLKGRMPSSPLAQ